MVASRPAFARVTCPLAAVCLAVCALLVVAALTAGPAAANPSQRVRVLTFTTGPRDLAGLRASASQARAEVARLDARAEIAIERYDLARARLSELDAQLMRSRAALARAEAASAAAMTTLGQRAAEMYKTDGLNVLDVLLGASDLTDVSTQLDFYRKLSEEDQRQAARYDQMARVVDEITAEIDAAKATALQVEAELAGRKANVEDQLAQREAFLAGLDTRIKALLAERARKAAAEAARLARAAGMDLGHIVGTKVQLAVVAEAMKYLGIPYVWAGATPSGGFDCSGLVLYVYAKFGISFPHGATMQAHMGTPVPLGQIQPADLVFFGDPSFYHHVGIYIGNGMFIEAPHTGDVVKISPLAGRGASLFCRYPLRMP